MAICNRKDLDREMVKERIVRFYVSGGISTQASQALAELSLKVEDIRAVLEVIALAINEEIK